MSARENFKVIGLGGIGSVVAEGLAMYLASEGERAGLWLVDGDGYEEKNRSRMRYEDDGNKALSKAAELAERGAGALTIVPTPAFVTPRNVRHIVEEHDIVFLCVDNHSTRRTVSRRCRKLDNVLLISGGNDGVEKGRSGTFGNVMVYRRAAGVDVTHPLTRFHPEIARPADKTRRAELRRAREDERASASVHELLVASAMLATFYSFRTGTLDFEELYLDIAGVKVTPVARAR